MLRLVPKRLMAQRQALIRPHKVQRPATHRGPGPKPVRSNLSPSGRRGYCVSACGSCKWIHEERQPDPARTFASSVSATITANNQLEIGTFFRASSMVGFTSHFSGISDFTDLWQQGIVAWDWVPSRLDSTRPAFWTPVGCHGSSQCHAAVSVCLYS